MSGYRLFHGLTHAAFGKGITRPHLLTYPHLEEFCEEMNTLVGDGGVGVLTGEMGIGKTTALRYFLGTLEGYSVQLCYQGSSRHSNAVLEQLVENLGVTPARGRATLLRQVTQRVGRAFREQKTKTLVILDDAQLLDDDLLEDMRLLTNFEMDSEDAMILLLVGHPALRKRLQKPVHLALADRARMHYRLEGLSEEETLDYIECHLRFSGAAHEIFTKDAKQAIFEHAQGIPRRINDLALSALKKSARKKMSTIKADFIANVVSSIRSE